MPGKRSRWQPNQAAPVAGSDALSPFWSGSEFRSLADDVSRCAVGVVREGPFAPGEMSRTLERAWNTNDAQTLAMFADHAHVLSAWGQDWEGKSELSSFLYSFFYRGVGETPARPLQTLAQCEDGHTVIWTFRYPYSVNSALIFTVENNRVVTAYWQFLPTDLIISQSESRVSPIGIEAPVSAALEAGAIALAGSGLMCMVVLSDRTRRQIHMNSELLSALRARVETSTQTQGPRPGQKTE